ncbi:MAG TPA: hypothetical protein DC010_06500 [Psychrobacter sp.]|nr:hypothetical protein [Psychrobacter sp.]HBL97905.1 hypothetical protein [Psychrobacter sp.]HCI31257.1 hypothetical protein [Psychrobacter sp.]
MRYTFKQNELIELSLFTITIRNFLKSLGIINAAVVGLLLAAFYQPVWTSAILDTKNFGLL